jgi:hypothetical protein
MVWVRVPRRSQVILSFAVGAALLAFGALLRWFGGSIVGLAIAVLGGATFLGLGIWQNRTRLAHPGETEYEYR